MVPNYIENSLAAAQFAKNAFFNAFDPDDLENAVTNPYFQQATRSLIGIAPCIQIPANKAVIVEELLDWAAFLESEDFDLTRPAPNGSGKRKASKSGERFLRCVDLYAYAYKCAPTKALQTKVVKRLCRLIESAAVDKPMLSAITTQVKDERIADAVLALDTQQYQANAAEIYYHLARNKGSTTALVKLIQMAHNEMKRTKAHPVASEEIAAMADAQFINLRYAAEVVLNRGLQQLTFETKTGNSQTFKPATRIAALIICRARDRLFANQNGPKASNSTAFANSLAQAAAPLADKDKKGLISLVEAASQLLQKADRCPPRLTRLVSKTLLALSDPK